MIKRIVVLAVMSAVMFAQQRTMTVAQLSGFIKSSVEQKLDDKQIAEVLKRTKLSEKLDQQKLTELMNLGAGPRTSAALRELSESSMSLAGPAAVPAAAAPKLRVATMAPPQEEQQKILEAIRQYALNYTQNLPNFFCTQVTRRQVDSTGTGDHYREVDKLQEQLTYFEHQEKYKVMAVNGQLVNNKDHLKLGGAISSGEFGSMMYEIFAPETAAEFEFDHVGKWDGRLVNEFRYHIPQERSHYTIYHEGVNKTITAGYHGVVYAAADTSAVVRITLECEQIPPDFPVQDVKIDLRYDVAKISEQEYMLPVRWEMHSKDGRYLAWNSAEFSLYRKFEATTSLSFDTADDNDTKKEDAKPPVKKKQ